MQTSKQTDRQVDRQRQACNEMYAYLKVIIMLTPLIGLAGIETDSLLAKDSVNSVSGAGIVMLFSSTAAAAAAAAFFCCSFSAFFFFVPSLF